jgi:hypothetical protein
VLIDFTQLDRVIQQFSAPSESGAKPCAVPVLSLYAAYSFEDIMKSRSNSLHNRLIDVACENGWTRTGWKAAVRRTLSRPPWDGEGGEIIEYVNAMPCTPDAWRFRLEGAGDGPGWCYEVLVLELLEVEVTNPIDIHKLQQYEKLWWQMDGSSCFHLRVFRMDRYGFVVPFMAEGYTISFGQRHAPGGQTPIWYYEVPFLSKERLEEERAYRGT